MKVYIIGGCIFLFVLVVFVGGMYRSETSKNQTFLDVFPVGSCVEVTEDGKPPFDLLTMRKQTARLGSTITDLENLASIEREAIAHRTTIQEPFLVQAIGLRHIFSPTEIALTFLHKNGEKQTLTLEEKDGKAWTDKDGRYYWIKSKDCTSI